MAGLRSRNGCSAARLGQVTRQTNRPGLWALSDRPYLWAAIAGFCICAALPPWGWWPLAFVGVAIVDRVLANQSTRRRFSIMTTAGVTWFFPSTLWMFDLTPAGYPIAALFFASLFGVAAAMSPAGRGRRLALPATFVLAELIRWTWPFGGIPLAHLALTQVNAPLAYTARLFGPLLIVALVMVGGQSLSALVGREWRDGLLGAIFIAGMAVLAGLAPIGKTVETIDIAVVQGGGQQRTRASVEGAQLVFERHVAATQTIDRSVDLIVWPENVVNPQPGSAAGGVDATLYEDEARPVLEGLAKQFDAVVLPGWFTIRDDGGRDNFTEAIEPDGQVSDRYDKVRIVPFGEFVPLRSLIERFSADLPNADVVAGTGPAVLDTSLGDIGISISWEIFFESRARDGIENGGRVLVNPTNGASYWLTILQTQQVASSQLRAIENGRWVLQAAPTGFSAIISPRGRVAERTGIGEAKVIYATIGLREGNTVATQWGFYPMLAMAITAIAIARRGTRTVN